MNEFSQLQQEYARDLVRQRERTTRTRRPADTASRRTARRALATGLHRIANRLDGGL